MAKKHKYRKIEASDFYDYFEGNLSNKDRNAFERQLEKDLFESDAADGLSMVSREESEQDLKFISGKIEKRTNRTKRIVWYSAAAAIASILVVSTIFFNLDDTSMDKYKSAPEMREMAKEKPVGVAKGLEKGDAEVGAEEESAELNAEERAEAENVEKGTEEGTVKDDENAKSSVEVTGIESAEEIIVDDSEVEMEKGQIYAMEISDAEEIVQADIDMGKGDSKEEAVENDKVADDDLLEAVKVAAAPLMRQEEAKEKSMASQSSRSAAKKVTMTNVDFSDNEIQEVLTGQVAGVSITDLDESVIIESGTPADGIITYQEYIDTNLIFPANEAQVEEAIVILSFTVTPEGRPNDLNIISSPSQLFSDEALRVIKEGPDWIPAKVNDEDEIVSMKIVFNKN
ncbi:MAG: energy transducer TonB [Bacteroidales bacterium]|jgi:outer membrane biosynthesis protein TonB|nr:energy transducer TonB [Bacteroidales bacterium]